MNSVLQPGETVKAIGRLHWINYLKAFLLAAIGVVLLLYGQQAPTTAGRTAMYLGWLLLVVAGIIFLGAWFRRSLALNPHFSLLWAPIARRYA